MSRRLDEDVAFLRAALRRLGEDCIKAVVLFGSTSRGERRERSDVDLLVLHEGCRVDDPVERRRHLYDAVKRAIGERFEAITILDMEFKEFVSPGEVTPLLLNIYWDGVVVYDKTGRLEDFLARVKERIAASGLRRVRDGDAYYWTLPEPMKEVEIL
jgi:predicted nucleotidyltransferase